MTRYASLWHDATMLREPENLSDEQIEIWHQASEYFYRGYQHQKHGDIAGAIQDYKQSLFIYPTAEAHTFLGRAFSLLQLYDEAIAGCKRAIQVDPSYGNAYNDIGAYLVELEQPHSAIPWFKRALQAPYYRERVNPLLNLGRVYQRLGSWQKALISPILDQGRCHGPCSQRRP